MFDRQSLVIGNKPLCEEANGGEKDYSDFSKVFDRQSLVIGNKPLCEKANGGGKD